jgi:hypothetical protein
MRLRRIIWTCSALAGLAWAQEKKQPEESEKFTSKLIPVRYVNVTHMRDLLSVPGVSVKADAEMHALVVSGRADAVTTLEEMVKKLDIAPTPPPPRPNIELTVYMLSGSTEGKSGHGDEVPADLSSTVKQLHQLFPYKSYRILDSFMLRGRDGARGNTTGSIPSPAGLPPATYRFDYLSAVLGDGTPRTIRLNGLNMNIRAPFATSGSTQFTYSDSGVSTDLDLREGQKVVVGKSNYGTDDAFILVVTAKVVE